MFPNMLNRNIMMNMLKRKNYFRNRKTFWLFFGNLHEYISEKTKKKILIFTPNII